ncbi:hypothetical protein CBL_12458 [Carabus blaptoides fortunei]
MALPPENIQIGITSVPTTLTDIVHLDFPESLITNTAHRKTNDQRSCTYIGSEAKTLVVEETVSECAIDVYVHTGDRVRRNERNGPRTLEVVTKPVAWTLMKTSAMGPGRLLTVARLLTDVVPDFGLIC